ncbi:DUF960 domain-containing protein [Paenibacillus alginolyticus]|uniref:DUF960 family protein n=1 Tax=Paenibacillus alginolyticus TaxID=59839 RepID=UPI0004924D5C|nr:DUF960 family protein [Paenibacillus alginolyticus]MCY9664913.1 DUF960 domain-containing protein [Paenibacillus alginolyticus]
MFPKHARYMTRGVRETISLDIQDALWAIIDRNLGEGKAMDYLQVFSLTIVHTDNQIIQRIRQRQEEPERKQKYDLTGIAEPVSGVTVWIIDSGTYCTMLLPNEY